MNTARIVTNVGYIKDSPTSKYGNVFLALTENQEYFLTSYRAAFTHEGESYPAQWTHVTKDWLNNEQVLHNISNNVLNLVTLPIFVEGEQLGLGGLAVGVITNGANFVTGAGDPAFVNSFANVTSVPAKYSLIGTGYTAEQVENLIGIDVLPAASRTVGGVVLNSNSLTQLRFPTLDKQPVEAITAAVKQPIEFAKANPISAVFIGAGVVEVGNVAGLWSTSILKQLGIRKKDTKKKKYLLW